MAREAIASAREATAGIHRKCQRKEDKRQAQSRAGSEVTNEFEEKQRKSIFRKSDSLKKRTRRGEWGRGRGGRVVKRREGKRGW